MSMTREEVQALSRTVGLHDPVTFDAMTRLVNAALAARSGFYEEMRRTLIGQVHELIDIAERHAWTDDAEEKRRTLGAIEHARKVTAPYNYNGTRGVPVTVAVNRPATLEEAEHAARIGACLPNGVMLDAFGNPRKRYTRVTLEGAHLILDDVQLAEFKAEDPDPDQYTYSDVYLSQEEADALPEFDGF
jgi:hypothetical protein